MSNLNVADLGAIETIYRAASAEFLEHGAIRRPFAQIHTSTGVITFRAPPISSDEDKLTFASLIRCYAIVTQAERVVLAMECWSSRDRTIAVRPGLRPDRQEGVALIVESPEGRTAAMVNIQRHGFPHLGKLGNLEFEAQPSERGIFSGLLPAHDRVGDDLFAAALAYLHTCGHIDLAEAKAELEAGNGVQVLRLWRVA